MGAGSGLGSSATLSRGGGGNPRTPSHSRYGQRTPSSRLGSSPSLVSVLGTQASPATRLFPSGRVASARKSDQGSFAIRRPQTPIDKLVLPSSASKSVSKLSSQRKQNAYVSRGNGIDGIPQTPPRTALKTGNRCVYDPSIVRTPLSTSRKAKYSSPSCRSGDRFIPNRAHLRVDLCRASFLSAEKRRIEVIDKAVENRRQQTGDNTDPNTGSPSSSPAPARGDPLTPLQSEFRRRMTGALLNIPLEELTSEPASRSTRQSEQENNVFAHSVTGLNLSEFGRNDLRNLAYAAIPDYDENSGPGGISSGGGATSQTRMLSFRDTANVNDSLTSINSSASSISSGELRRSQSNNLGPAAYVAAADPYSHDQLRVLHRSAAGSSGRSLSNPGMDSRSLAETGLRSVAQKVGRRIPAAPSRILDAPDLVDDYYLNLVSWGKDNVLAVALGQCVYLWDAANGDIKHLLTLEGEDDYATSVAWATTPGNTQYIAVGTNNSPVQLWDAEALKKVRTLSGHSARVGALSWNNQWLSSGGRDSVIIQHDVRSSNNVAATYTGHTQEVCGLKWNDEGTTLASGGNENYLCLWDVAMSGQDRNSRNSRAQSSLTNVSPRFLLTQHKAAVKALAWCPFNRGVLASGGGTADRTIKFWNTNSGTVLNSIDTGSQVCSLLWSKHQKEICSSHGFSENQLILWRYPTMTKIQEFKGHTARVLHMEQSPDGGCVVSAAADETLRFWDIFGAPPSKGKTDSFGVGAFNMGMSQIR